MTTLRDKLALVPLLVATALRCAGLEIQKHRWQSSSWADSITSTTANLFIVPVLYLRFARPSPPALRPGDGLKSNGIRRVPGEQRQSPHSPRGAAAYSDLGPVSSSCWVPAGFWRRRAGLRIRGQGSSNIKSVCGSSPMEFENVSLANSGTDLQRDFSCFATHLKLNGKMQGRGVRPGGSWTTWTSSGRVSLSTAVGNAWLLYPLGQGLRTARAVC
mgnify:CR=1 FL=1